MSKSEDSVIHNSSGALAEETKLEEGHQEFCVMMTNLLAGQVHMPDYTSGRHWDTCFDKA